MYSTLHSCKFFSLNSYILHYMKTLNFGPNHYNVQTTSNQMQMNHFYSQCMLILEYACAKRKCFSIVKYFVSKMQNVTLIPCHLLLIPTAHLQSSPYPRHPPILFLNLSITIGDSKNQLSSLILILSADESSLS